MTKHPVILIMQNEWRRFGHARVPVILFFILLVLWSLAGITSYLHWQTHARIVTDVTQQSQQDWQSQPDRHPHRVSHYGDFVAKPTHPLSIIEPGILDQAGHVVYLEAHRLNSANFNPAIEATSLGRFPRITPAMIVQWWMPLFLIVVGYGCITTEKLSGTLAYMRGNGTSAWQVTMGKYFALFLPLAFLILLQCVITLVGVWSSDQAFTRVGLLLLGQLFYVAGWCWLVLLVSWRSRHLHSALLTLLLCWVCICIIFPKVLANLAQIQHPTQPRTEAEYHAEMKLKEIGDSHNPDDPHFAEFKAALLKQYGVTRVEDLPVNYNGLLMQEGERLTTQVYREQQALHQQQLNKQNDTIRRWLWLTPALALNYLQMASSGNDLAHHLAFLNQAEIRRFKLIQYLNQIHTHQVHQHDDKNTRVSADFWKKAPRPPVPLASLAVSQHGLFSACMVLLLWTFLPCFLARNVIHK